MNSPSNFDRRQLLSFAAFSSVAAGALNANSALSAVEEKATINARAAKRYSMKKSINLWAFPYPGKMSLRECLELAKRAGFDGIELNYDLESDLSPKASTQDLVKIRKMADEIGIAISGLCSFLFWPYPLTSNDPVERARGMELAEKMTQAVLDLEIEDFLVVLSADHNP